MSRRLVSGKVQGIPYSLSRWTDLPICKWRWFKQQLDQGYMTAFDPRSAIPKDWSLAPEDTLGLIFWTKNPTNLIKDASLLTPYNIKIHVTLTGWHEAEKGAPSLEEGSKLLRQAVDTFGSERIVWRFSPVPLISDVVERFEKIAREVGPSKVSRVYLSFLQPNDLLPETRDAETRMIILRRLADVGEKYRVKILLCNEDKLLSDSSLDLPKYLSSGVCSPPEDFALESRELPPSEGCGCVLATDPFTVNETCVLGCKFCYAADKSLSPKKRNTTNRHLEILP